MKEYLLLFRGGDSAAQQSPEGFQQHMQRWMAWMGELSSKGKFVGAQPLTNTGRQLKGTGRLLSDGPFMEGKEMVGGYLICKAADYNEAVELSKDCPVLEFSDGIVEIREIQELNM